MPTIKDRSRLCVFTFADGRQCRSLRWPGHQHLCYEHAKREAEAGISKQAREDLVSLFCGKVLSAPDFAAALGRVLSAVAFGHIKPKAAVTLALLGHTLNQSIELAQHEYANAPGGNARRDQAHSSAPQHEPQSPPQPTPLQVPSHLESILVQNVR